MFARAVSTFKFEELHRRYKGRQMGQQCSTGHNTGSLIAECEHVCPVNAKRNSSLCIRAEGDESARADSVWKCALAK